MTPQELAKYIPDFYNEGQFYPVPNTKWEVARTRGRGKNARKSYITARYPITIDLVDSQGNVLQENYREGITRFRACLSLSAPPPDRHWRPLDMGKAGEMWRFEELPDMEN